LRFIYKKRLFFFLLEVNDAARRSMPKLPSTQMRLLLAPELTLSNAFGFPLGGDTAGSSVAARLAAFASTDVLEQDAA
jgi:hypothetical protein